MAGGIRRAFPLTPLQEGMLYHSLRDPTSGLYHGQVDARLRGVLDEVRFREAWRVAAERHEIFRTVFAWELRERPLQVVLDSAPLPMRFLDWRGLDPDERAARWRSVVAKDRAQPFDLAKPPLMRWVVAREDDLHHRVLWGVHHALVDGWSALSIMGEVLADHERLETSADVARPDAPSFAQFVGWLDERDRGAARDHWTRALRGLERAAPLPYAASGPTGSVRVTADLELTVSDTSATRAAAARHRVTLNTLLVGAWARILARRTGQADVLFGVTGSERPAAIPGVESAAGLYLTTVPVRVRLDPSVAVGSWLANLQKNLADGREHGAPGLAEIQRWSDIREGPLLTSLVVFESFPAAVAETVEGRSLEVLDMSMAGPSDLPLALLAYPGDRLRLELFHDPESLPAEEANGLLLEVAKELGRLRGSGTRTLAELGDPLSSQEMPDRRGATEASPAASPVDGPPLEDDPVDVVALVEAHARSRPDAIALSGPAEEVSYAQLDARANALAHRIREAGGGSEVYVGVVAGRVPDGVVALLGTLKAGCAYVPIDPQLPRARLEAMLEATDLVLLTSEHEVRLPSGQPRLLLDIGESDFAARSPLPTVREPSTDAAYAIFTSGSTGVPKAVVVERRQLAWSTAARLRYFSEHPGVFLLLSPFHVDSATAGIYWALCSAGTLVLPPARAEQDVEVLSRLVEEKGVTHTLMVPSLYQTLLDHADPARLSSLRVVVVAGEACRDAVARTHRKLLGHAELHNEYGPSEATVWATVANLSDASGETVTIGAPVPGARIHLVDSEGRETPRGEPGEIGISGPGVARGYLGRPDLTAARFVETPSSLHGRMYLTGDRGRWRTDGRLQFLGRVDDQVKIRGHRVEVGEIESALAKHPAVRESLVSLVHSDGDTPNVEELATALMSLNQRERYELLAQAEAME
jgi:amino acid adenylation domain-containing protein